MRIGGLQKFSLIDYPGKLASVIFAQGCNFRCQYCYNPELVIPEEFCETIPEQDVLTFLKRRKAYLEGVVVSGGEPTIQEDLISFLNKIKMLGYLVKLDTNGSRPEVLEKIIKLKLVNYIAMDVKAPFHKYEEIIGVTFPYGRIKASIEIIINSGIKHEFRTTAAKPLCPYADILQITEMIKGAQRYNVQGFITNEKVLNKHLLEQDQYTEDDIRALQSIGEKHLMEVA